MNWITKMYCRVFGHKERHHVFGNKTGFVWCRNCFKELHEKPEELRFWKKLKQGDLCLTKDGVYAKCIHVNKGASLFADFETMTPFSDIGAGMGNNLMNCSPSQLIGWEII